MIGGIGDTGRTLDFNIIMYTTDELGLGNPIEEVIEKVIKSRADGVVLFNNNCIDKEIDLIKKYQVAFLQLLLDIRFLMKISVRYMLMQRVLHMI